MDDKVIKFIMCLCEPNDSEVWQSNRFIIWIATAHFIRLAMTVYLQVIVLILLGITQMSFASLLCKETRYNIFPVAKKYWNAENL